jgi:hypothetical protein
MDRLQRGAPPVLYGADGAKNFYGRFGQIRVADKSMGIVRVHNDSIRAVRYAGGK